MSPRPEPPARLLTELEARSDAELERVLVEADDLDERLQAGRATAPRDAARLPVEIVFLGALGCRLGMLMGGAGGLLVTMHGTTLLVDPGPAALSRLAALEAAGTFSFADLDAILCTHLHPDHTAGLLPCIEGMLAAPSTRRRAVIGNHTVIERFGALSPFHFRELETAALAPGGEPLAAGGVTVAATPAKHVEEAGSEYSAIGFLLKAGEDTVWYSGDTTLYPDLLAELRRHAGAGAIAVANADASDVARRPGKAEKCHLLTRDIPVVCEALRPAAFVVQHYDEAYASLRYRAAQAIYAQRQVDRDGLGTLVLFAGDGLRLGFREGRLEAAEALLDAEDGAGAAAFATLARDRRPVH